MPVNRWRIFCNTENDWVYGWRGADEPEPTACFNNNAHTINAASISIIQVVCVQIMKIEEETGHTQGNFRLEGLEMTCPANCITSTIFEFKYDISLLLIWINIEESNKGDTFDTFYQPGITGLIKSSLTIGSTSMTIDPVFIRVVNIGHIVFVKKPNLENLENLGEILTIDKINNIITFETPVVSNYTVDDIVLIQVHGVKNSRLVHPGRHYVGIGKIGGSFLPKTGKNIIKYTNKSLTTSKNFYFELEYLY